MTIRLRRWRWTRDPWATLVAALAAYRLTRLVTTDDLPPARKLRALLSEKTPDEYAALWSCPWCMGAWVSLGVTLVAEAADRKGRRDTFLLAALPWAISAVVGMLAEREIS